MSKAVAKLGFLHRRLWQQDGLYRASILFGPGPLIGCALAVAVWAAAGALKPAPAAPPWAKVEGPVTWDDAKPNAVAPAHPLPASGPGGALVGFAPGWNEAVAPVTINPTDVDVSRERIGRFTGDSPDIDFAQIVRHGPDDRMFVGVGFGFLAVRTAGVYAIAARLDRDGGARANCLLRLGFGPHRINSNIEIGVPASASKTFDAPRFDLQPGLYPIGWAFGCWHGKEIIGTAHMTVLIGHPGENGLQPARDGDIVRPESKAE